MSFYNSQCGRINRFAVESAGSGAIIYLDAHRLATEHVRLVLDGTRVRMPNGHEWPEAVLLNTGLDGRGDDLLQVMREVVIMQPPEGVTVALALDWYQERTPGDDDWTYTTRGQLVHDAKYDDNLNPPEVEAIERTIASVMASVMERHTVYGDTGAIVTTPSSILRNKGSAERTAEYLAETTGLRLVRTTGHTPVRPQRKSGTDFDLTNEFIVDPTHVRGQAVVIVDDLYRNGETMRGVALAARRAGARVVLGLAGARTMRN
jgi:pyrimidine operon attenuation protein/uracil phosphoribosyltransferase